MAYKRVAISGLDVMVDQTTGAMLVAVSGITFAGTVELGSVGVFNATDQRINPAKEDGNLATLAGKDFATQTTLAAVLAKLVAAPALEGGNLASILANLGAVVLAGPQTVTVDSTANGKTLQTLLGSALNTGLKRLVLLPAGPGIAWAWGNAAGTEVDLVAGSFPYNKAGADNLHFKAKGDSVAMAVIQIG